MKQDFSKGISTRVTDEMFQELYTLSEKDQRPLSNMVRMLITEALQHRRICKCSPSKESTQQQM